jgi:hypothetical protein
MPNENPTARLRVIGSACKFFDTSEGGENGSFAKPLYGLTPVPRVRISTSPPWPLDCVTCLAMILR